jgi:hypothetical protein
MRIVRLLRFLIFTMLCGGTLLSVSCGDVLISSVKTGLFSVISGSVITTLGSSQLGALLSGLTTPGTTSGTSSAG